MRARLVAGNWKMHGSLASNARLLDALKAGLKHAEGVDCAVCAPFPYLAQVSAALSGSRIAWGAQDVGEPESVVGRQLDAVLASAGSAALADAALAYEPVWAIGTGKNAAPREAQDVHAFIRARLAARDKGQAQRVTIMYGGSVKPGNAAELFAMPDIDGGLIGGASLAAEDFIAICAAAQG